MDERMVVVDERVVPLPAQPGAAPLSRRALRELLRDTPFENRLDDGELAISELVTNAVLHGRDPLVLRLIRTPACVRVEVTDASPISPSFSMLDPTAVTGRGLMLISAASDRWGVEPAGTGKSVWFELHDADADDDLEADVDALLAAWGDDLSTDPALEQVRVVLTDLDTQLLARAEAHVEGLLRELCLLSTDEVPPATARVVRRVLDAATAMDAVRAHLKHQLAVAVSAGQPRVDISLTIQRSDAELVRDYARAVDEADRLSRAGQLLTTPAPAELSDVRGSYLRRLLAQLSS